MSEIARQHGIPSPLARLAPTLASGLLLIAAAACASSPGADTDERAAPTRQVLRVGSTAAVEMYTEAGIGESVIMAPSEAVWEVLPAVFEQLEIPVNRRDVRVPELGNLGYQARRVEGRRMGNYIDCGTNLSGQLANLYEIQLSILTRLADGPEGTTVVTTTVDAYGEPRSTSGNQVHCQSREVLEKRVAELVAERLGVIGG
jgi:hypothetical protein